MKKLRTILSLVLVCTSILGCMVFTTGAASVDDFKDLDKNADYYEAVEWAVKNGYMNGVSATVFSPDTTLTRAQFATLMAGYDGADLTVYKGKQIFTDVKTNAWYAQTAAWAYENGIMSGTGNNKFSPDTVITREQIAVLVQNYVKYKGVYLEKVTPETRLMDKGSKRASAWAKDSVVYAYKHDYMQLDENDCFNPKDKVARGEAAIILYSLNRAIERTTADRDPMVVGYLDCGGAYNDSDFKNFDVLNMHPAKADGTSRTINDGFVKRIDQIRPIALQQNPDMKFVLTVTVNSGADIEKWLYPYSSCDDFADKIVEIVKKYDFDGVDFDYEFPTGNVPQKNLEYFLTVLRQKLDALKVEMNKPDDYEYIISMAIAGGTWSFKLFQDLSELQHYLTYINYMNYDLRSETNITCHHAATYDGNSPYRMPAGGYGSLVYGEDAPLNYAASTYADVYWSIYSGIQRQKIVIGAGLYCQRWTGVQGYQLEDGTWVGLYCAGNPDSDNTAYGQIAGMINYEDRTQPIGGYYSYWDEAAQSMCLYNPGTKMFIALDEKWSLEAKCQMVVDNNLGGIMLFNQQGGAGIAVDYKYDEELGEDVPITIYDQFNDWLDRPER